MLINDPAFEEEGVGLLSLPVGLWGSSLPLRMVPEGFSFGKVDMLFLDEEFGLEAFMGAPFLETGILLPKQT